MHLGGTSNDDKRRCKSCSYNLMQHIVLMRMQCALKLLLLFYRFIKTSCSSHQPKRLRTIHLHRTVQMHHDHVITACVAQSSCIDGWDALGSTVGDACNVSGSVDDILALLTEFLCERETEGMTEKCILF